MRPLPIYLFFSLIFARHILTPDNPLSSSAPNYGLLCQKSFPSPPTGPVNLHSAEDSAEESPPSSSPKGMTRWLAGAARARAGEPRGVSLSWNVGPDNTWTGPGSPRARVPGSGCPADGASEARSLHSADRTFFFTATGGGEAASPSLYREESAGNGGMVRSGAPRPFNNQPCLSLGGVCVAK